MPVRTCIRLEYVTVISYSVSSFSFSTSIFSLFISSFLLFIDRYIDVYAHNVLVTIEGHAKLCDFGASFFYSPTKFETGFPAGFEKVEVQAYGLLVHDLSIRLAGEVEEVSKIKHVLDRIVEMCRSPSVVGRPSFGDIVNMLK